MNDLFDKPHVKNHRWFKNLKADSAAKEKRLAKHAQSLDLGDSTGKPNLSDMFSSANRLGLLNNSKKLPDLIKTAILTAREAIDQFDFPISPSISYLNVKNVKTAGTTDDVLSGTIILQCKFATVGGLKQTFDIPVQVVAGKVLPPSVVKFNGRDIVLAQSSVNAMVQRASSYELIPVRQQFSAPLTRDERESATELRNEIGYQAREGLGPVSICKRTYSKKAQEDLVQEGFERENLNAETFFELASDYHRNEGMSLAQAFSKTWNQFCDLNRTENLDFTFDELDEIRESAYGMFFPEKRTYSKDAQVESYAVEVVDTINDEEQGGKVVQHVFALGEDKAKAKFDFFVKKYVEGKGDQYVVQILDPEGRIIQDTQGGGETGIRVNEEGEPIEAESDLTDKITPNEPMADMDDAKKYQNPPLRARKAQNEFLVTDSSPSLDSDDADSDLIKAVKDWDSEKVKELVSRGKISVGEWEKAMTLATTYGMDDVKRQLIRYRTKALPESGKFLYKDVDENTEEDSDIDLNHWAKKDAVKTEYGPDDQEDYNFSPEGTDLFHAVEIEDVELVRHLLESSGVGIPEREMFYAWTAADEGGLDEIKQVLTEFGQKLYHGHFKDSRTASMGTHIPGGYEKVKELMDKAQEEGKDTFPRSWIHVLRNYILEVVATASQDAWLTHLVNDGYVLNPYGSNNRGREKTAQTTIYGNPSFLGQQTEYTTYPEKEKSPEDEGPNAILQYKDVIKSWAKENNIHLYGEPRLEGPTSLKWTTSQMDDRYADYNDFVYASYQGKDKVSVEHLYWDDDANTFSTLEEGFVSKNKTAQIVSEEFDSLPDIGGVEDAWQDEEPEAHIYDGTKTPMEPGDSVKFQGHDGAIRGTVVEVNKAAGNAIVKAKGYEYRVALEDIQPLNSTFKKMYANSCIRILPTEKKYAQIFNNLTKDPSIDDPWKATWDARDKDIDSL